MQTQSRRVTKCRTDEGVSSPDKLVGGVGLGEGLYVIIGCYAPSNIDNGDPDIDAYHVLFYATQDSNPASTPLASHSLELTLKG